MLRGAVAFILNGVGLGVGPFEGQAQARSRYVGPEDSFVRFRCAVEEFMFDSRMIVKIFGVTHGDDGATGRDVQ